MKFQFVYPNFTSDMGDLQIGVATLSAVLKNEGHKVDLIHLKARDRDNFQEKVERGIRRFKPDMIGISATELEAKFIGPIAAIARKDGIPCIVGGPYATLAPEEIISTEGVGYVSRGEADISLPALLDKIEGGKKADRIKGIWAKGKRIHRNKLAKPPDMDGLPFPDRSIFDKETITGHKLLRKTRVGLMSSRGCPFDCTYCINAHLRSLYPRCSYVRFRNPDSVIEELEMLAGKYRFEYVVFYDDTMLLNRKWIREFSEKYRKRFDLPFTLNARPETCTRELLGMASRAGCDRINIGVESGSEGLRKKVLRRMNTNEQIITAFKNCREFGLRTYSFNMVGLPYETDEDIMKTVMLNARVRTDYIQVSIFYPFRGTVLGDLCYEKGWVSMEKKKEVESYFEDAIVEYPQLSAEKINRHYRRFAFLCYWHGRHWRSLFGYTSSSILRKLRLLDKVEPIYQKFIG